MSRPSLGIWMPAIRAGSGADVFALRLERGLRKAGHRPMLQWFDRRYELAPWRLRSAAPPPGTDVIQAGSWQGFAFRRAGLPLVVTEHQYIDHPAFKPHRRPLQRIYHEMLVRRWVARSYAAADALVAVSRHVAEAMHADLDREIELIRNWVDGTEFMPRPLAALAPSPLRLLFVGNPSGWKGADVLLPLAEMLGPDVEIWCLGGLRRSASVVRRHPRIRLLPSVPPAAMPGMYLQHHAALVPTRYEAFGYVALEAMACGLPVLGFDSTGTGELVVHGETGLLAPMDDVATLASLALRLAAEPALRMRLGTAGRARALACFDEEPAIEKYVALYRGLIAGHPSHGSR